MDVPFLCPTEGCWYAPPCPIPSSRLLGRQPFAIAQAASSRGVESLQVVATANERCLKRYEGLQLAPWLPILRACIYFTVIPLDPPAEENSSGLPGRPGRLPASRLERKTSRKSPNRSWLIS